MRPRTCKMLSMKQAPEALAGLLFLVLAGNVAAAQAKPAMPGQGDDFFNLGPTGATGTPLKPKESEALGIPKGSVGIRVEKAAPGSPCAGRLEAGDIIVAAAGRGFPAKDDPMLCLSRAIEAAEAAKVPVLKLSLLRSGKPAAAAVELPALGAHSRTCPASCPKCRAVIDAGLAYLAKAQESDGSFPCATGGINGKIAVTTIAGLAFMAADEKPAEGRYAAVVKRAIAYVMRNAGTESRLWDGQAQKGANWSQLNWNLGYAPWLLAEAWKATGEEAAKAKVAELARKIVETQEKSGGWAHGPGGPNALDYLELEIVSNFCLASLGFARRIGVEVPQEPIDRGVAYIVATGAGDGGVGYSTRAGQQGFGDPGRTAGAIVAFQALGLARHGFFGKMTGYYRRTLPRLIGGHVSPCMHLLSGAIAAELGENRTSKAFRDEFRDEIMAARVHDGSFNARPTTETQQLHHNTDRGVGPAWTTAHFTLILLVPESRLALVGK